MKRMAAGLGVWLVLGGAWAQQVWKCEVDGQVLYTNRPCDKSSQPLPARVLQANVADSPATEAARAAQAASVASAASPASEGPASAPAATADAASAVGQHALTTPPLRARRARAAQSPRYALQGLLQTDFVQRGYAPRRQNPASTPTP